MAISNSPTIPATTRFSAACARFRYRVVAWMYISDRRGAGLFWSEGLWRIQCGQPLVRLEHLADVRDFTGGANCGGEADPAPADQKGSMPAVAGYLLDCGISSKDRSQAGYCHTPDRRRHPAQRQARLSPINACKQAFGATGRKIAWRARCGGNTLKIETSTPPISGDGDQEVVPASLCAHNGAARSCVGKQVTAFRHLHIIAAAAHWRCPILLNPAEFFDPATDR